MGERMQIVVVLGRQGVSVPVEERYLNPELRKVGPKTRFVQGVGFYVVAVLAETSETLTGANRLKKLPAFRIEILQTEDRLEESSPVKILELGEMYLIKEKKPGVYIQRFEGFNSRQFEGLVSEDEAVREICLVTTR